jgi:hypothetical protein
MYLTVLNNPESQGNPFPQNFLTKLFLRGSTVRNTLTRDPKCVSESIVSEKVTNQYDERRDARRSVTPYTTRTVDKQIEACRDDIEILERTVEKVIEVIIEKPVPVYREVEVDVPIYVEIPIERTIEREVVTEVIMEIVTDTIMEVPVEVYVDKHIEKHIEKEIIIEEIIEVTIIP